MIKNAVLHIANEQPLMADLYTLPSSRDSGVLLTNLRSLTGTRPIFVDRIDSVFFFPYRDIRFIEMAPGSTGETAEEPRPAAEEAPPADEPEAGTRDRRGLPAARSRSLIALGPGAPPDGPWPPDNGPGKTRCYTPARCRSTW